MPILSVRADVRDAVRYMSDVQKQLPELTARAINRTLEETQTRMRQQLHTDFTMRGTNVVQFMERMVKIRSTDRATARNLTGHVRIEGPQSGSIGGAKRAEHMLTRHEDGGPASGANTFFGKFFIPNSALRTPSKGVPRSLYPKNLGLEPRRLIEGGFTKGQTRAKKKGRLGVYVVPKVGIFERFGGGRRDTALLWIFARHVDLAPRLRFDETTQRVVAERFPINIAGYLDSALRVQAQRAAR